MISFLIEDLSKDKFDDYDAYFDLGFVILRAFTLV